MIRLLVAISGTTNGKESGALGPQGLLVAHRVRSQGVEGVMWGAAGIRGRGRKNKSWPCTVGGWRGTDEDEHDSQVVFSCTTSYDFGLLIALTNSRSKQNSLFPILTASNKTSRFTYEIIWSCIKRQVVAPEIHLPSRQAVQVQGNKPEPISWKTGLQSCMVTDLDRVLPARDQCRLTTGCDADGGNEVVLV